MQTSNIMRHFLLNTPITKLPNPIDLTGLEVSVEVFKLPTIITVYDASVSYRDDTGTYEKVIPGGYFLNPASYAKHMNKVIASDGVSINFDERTQKVVVSLCERCSLQVSSRISVLLALPKGAMRGTVYSTRSVQFLQQSTLIFVSNITEPTPFDSRQLPVIHVANIDDHSRELQYYPTVGGTTDSINIQMLNRQAEKLTTIDNNYFFLLRFRKRINN